MFATFALIASIVALLYYLRTQKPRGYPPGPRWWPVLGCAREVLRLRKETGFLFKCFNHLHDKYGPVIGLKIGKDKVVVIRNFESIKSMVTSEDCDGRPTGPMFEARTWGARRGLLTVDGPVWLDQRKFVLRHLREFGYGRNDMASIVEDEAVYLVKHFKNLLDDKCDETVGRRASNRVNNNDCKNDGQIYKLEKNRIENSELRKRLADPADLYVKAEDYVEFRQTPQASGKIISMHDAFGVPVLNTLWMMMASKRYENDNKELLYLQKILTKLLNEIDMIGAPFSHFPILMHLFPELSGYKKFVETHRQLWRFIEKELENHKKTFNPSAPRDLMDAYTAYLRSNECGETFSDDQLLAICLDLFIAGSETTSKTLGFCFMYLLIYPDVQKKAQEEIDRIVGRDRFPTLSDRPRMTYLNAIVLESLRLFMGRTLNIPHRTLKEITIEGYRIPEDTMIVVNYNGILMNQFWKDPEEFRPERFIDENGALSVPEQFLPFSSGRHRCMGEVLAKSNIFLFTAALLQSFTFSTVPGERKPTKSDFVDGVTPSTIPFKALVTLRD